MLALGALVLMVWGIRRLLRPPRSPAAGHAGVESPRLGPARSRLSSSWRCSRRRPARSRSPRRASSSRARSTARRPTDDLLAGVQLRHVRGHGIDFRLRKRRPPHRLDRARRQARADARRRPLVRRGPGHARLRRRLREGPDARRRRLPAGRPPRAAHRTIELPNSDRARHEAAGGAACATGSTRTSRPTATAATTSFRVRVPARASRATAILLVDGRQARRARASATRAACCVWNGKVDGRVARAGQPRAADLRARTPPATARSRSRSRSCRCATSRSAATACSPTPGGALRGPRALRRPRR